MFLLSFFKSLSVHLTAPTASTVAMYLKLLPGVIIKYPETEPIVVAISLLKGTAAVKDAPKGAYEPNTAPPESIKPATKYTSCDTNAFAILDENASVIPFFSFAAACSFNFITLRFPLVCIKII